MSLKEISPLIALDVGIGRIGIAIFREDSIFVTPLGTITRDGTEYKKIMNIIEEEKVKTIVVGLPKTLKGEIGPQAEKVLKFIESLKGFVEGVEIVKWDERFTSVIAHRIFKARGYNTKEERKVKDSLEAELILESYINYIRRKG